MDSGDEDSDDLGAALDNNIRPSFLSFAKDADDKQANGPTRGGHAEPSPEEMKRVS